MTEERLSELMAQALVAHVSNARRGEGYTVELGGGLVVACLATEVPVPSGRGHAALPVRLDLAISGGPFGDVSVLESFAGVGSSLEESVVSGVHGWATSSLPALHAALLHEPATATCEVHGLPFALFEGNVLTRGASFEAFARALGEGSPVQRLLGALPVLSASRAHLVSCFGARLPKGNITLEVKVDGYPWPSAEPLIAPLLRLEPWPAEVSYASFRQSAVLRPLEEAKAARPSLDGILQTLRGLALSDPELEVFGASVHRYQLSPPVEKSALAAISAYGVKLPEDYYDFITRGFSHGAGPGYGLLPAHTQLEHLVGPFPRSSPASADEAVKGTLALAHVGCGYFSILVVDGPARGQVFADVRKAGDGIVPTHASFLDWYLDWLDSALTRRPPALPIQPGSCAFPQAISNHFNAIEEEQGQLDLKEAVSTLSEGSIHTINVQSDRYFDEDDPIDLCSYCEHLRRHLGITIELPGRLPKVLRGD